MVPLHKDGFQVDDTPVEPGDEAVMSDGTILKVGELKLVLRLYDRSGALIVDEPYVTRAAAAKRSRAGATAWAHPDAARFVGKRSVLPSRKTIQKRT